MNKEALGVIETVGMVAAIQAADTCVKSANVELIGYELTKGSGLVTIKIRGNVGAVKAAIEAAKVSAAAINKVYATLIIPRPAANLEGIIESDFTVGIKAKEAEQKNSADEENKDKVEDTVSIDEENKDKVEDTANVEKENKDKVEDAANIEEESKEKIEDTVTSEEENKDSLEDSTVEASNEDLQRVEQNQKDINTVDVNNEDDNNFEEKTKTLASNDSNLDNTSLLEDLQEEKNNDGYNEEIKEFSQDDSSLNEQENDEVCNICHDPACTRKKGQPKTLCINYKGTRG